MGLHIADFDTGLNECKKKKKLSPCMFGGIKMDNQR